MVRKCVQCGNNFVLTESEIEFYKSKGLSLPKRCSSCRAENRKSKNAMKNTIGVNSKNAVPVDAEANKQYHIQKKKDSPIYYAIAFLVIVAIGLITTKFGDFANPSNYIDDPIDQVQQQYKYNFASDELLQSHFEKHRDEFRYSNAEEYLEGANAVIENPSALHKIEAEDGDYCYYLQSTNEIVFVSPDGTIRTYFKPDDGLSYFNRQMKTVYHF